MIKPKECRRILASGARCHALAVKGTPFCHFHQAARDFHRENRKRSHSILIPALDDRASIQLAIGSILDAIGSSRIDPLRARAYLYGLQLAMQNLGKGLTFAASDSIFNPVCSETGELLAPEEDETEMAILSDSGKTISPVPEPSISAESESSPTRRDQMKASGSIHITEAESTSSGLERMKGTGLSPNISTSPDAGASAADGSENVEGTVSEISAAAEEPGDTASPLDRYGDLSSWLLKELELSDSELTRRKGLEHVVRNTICAILAATPFRAPSERQKLHRQLHAEYTTRYLAPEAEPLQCPVASRYQVHLLA